MFLCFEVQGHLLDVVFESVEIEKQGRGRNVAAKLHRNADANTLCQNRRIRPPDFGQARSPLRFLSWPWVAGLLSLLTLVMHAELIEGIGVSIAGDLGDPLLNTWILWWNAQQVPLTDAYWNAPSFAPMPNALALSETLLGLTWLTTPLQWMGASALVAYNVMFILAPVLNGLSAYWLCLVLTSRRDAALIGAAGVCVRAVSRRTDVAPPDRDDVLHAPGAGGTASLLDNRPAPMAGAARRCNGAQRVGVRLLPPVFWRAARHRHRVAGDLVRRSEEAGGRDRGGRRRRHHDRAGDAAVSGGARRARIDAPRNRERKPQRRFDVDRIGIAPSRRLAHSNAPASGGDCRVSWHHHRRAASGGSRLGVVTRPRSAPFERPPHADDRRSRPGDRDDCVRGNR